MIRALLLAALIAGCTAPIPARTVDVARAGDLHLGRIRQAELADVAETIIIARGVALSEDPEHQDLFVGTRGARARIVKWQRFLQVRVGDEVFEVGLRREEVVWEALAKARTPEEVLAYLELEGVPLLPPARRGLVGPVPPAPSAPPAPPK